MGTRSTYRFINKEGDINVNYSLVYFQYDGYPEGHPTETAEWLASGTVVNGIPMTDKLVFNGISDLITQFIAKYKKGPGGVYIYPLKDRGNCGEDYLYDIIVDGKNIIMKGYKYKNKLIFTGTPQEFVEHFK